MEHFSCFIIPSNHVNTLSDSSSKICEWYSNKSHVFIKIKILSSRSEPDHNWALREGEGQFPGCTDPSRYGLYPTAGVDQMTLCVLLSGPLICHQSRFAWSSNEVAKREECWHIAGTWSVAAFTLDWNKVHGRQNFRSGNLTSYYL